MSFFLSCLPALLLPRPFSPSLQPPSFSSLPSASPLLLNLFPLFIFSRAPPPTRSNLQAFQVDHAIRESRSQPLADRLRHSRRFWQMDQPSHGLGFECRLHAGDFDQVPNRGGSCPILREARSVRPLGHWKARSLDDKKLTSSFRSSFSPQDGSTSSRNPTFNLSSPRPTVRTTPTSRTFPSPCRPSSTSSTRLESLY